MSLYRYSRNSQLDAVLLHLGVKNIRSRDVTAGSVKIHCEQHCRRVDLLFFCYLFCEELAVGYENGRKFGPSKVVSGEKEVECVN